VVCWADTVTHAEWYVEIVDTYCKTIMIASQLRPDLPEIPPEKLADLLALKQRLGMGLPDARLDTEGAAPDSLEAAIDDYIGAAASEQIACPRDLADMDKLVNRLTEEVVAFLEKCA